MTSTPELNREDSKGAELPGVTGTAAIESHADGKYEQNIGHILKKTEETFRVLLDSMKEYAVFMMSTDGLVSTWNAGAERIIGYDFGEIIGKHLSIFYTPEDLLKKLPHDDLAITSRQGRYEVEGWRVKKDGSTYWAKTLITAVRDDNGKIIGFGKVIKDLTEKKKTERRLKKWEYVFENTAWGISLATPDGHFITVNKAFAKMHNSSPEQWPGRPLQDMFADESKEILPALAQIAHSTGHVTYDSIHVRNDGSTFPVSTEVSAFKDSDGKILFRAAHYRDITEKKLVEDRLRSSERRFSAMFELAPFIIALVKWPCGTIVAVNTAWTKFFGIPMDEAVGKTSIELGIYKNLNDRSYIIEEIERTGSIRRTETQVLTAAGEERIVINNTDLIEIDGEKFILGTLEDITDRKTAEKAIYESRAQLEATFHSMNDGLMVFDMNGNAVLCNEAEATMNGFSSVQEMMQNLSFFARVYEIMHPDGSLVPVQDWPISRVMRGESFAKVELRGRRTDTGQEWFFSFSGEPIRNNEGKQILSLVVTRDVTKEKEAEAALRSSEQSFRQLANAMPQIVWTAQPDGHLDYCNDRWYESAGIERVTGATPQWQSLLPQGEDKHYLRDWRRAVKAGRPYQAEYRFWEQRSQKYRWFIVRALPVCNEQGKPLK